MRALALLLSLAPAVAAAAPPTIAGDPAQVVLTVPGVEAASAPRAAGDRIEIDVAPPVTASKTYFGSDPTVRKVEILAGPAPKISVQVRHSREAIALLAGAAQVVEESGNVVLRFPRDRKLAAAAPAAPPPAPEAPAITVEPAAVQVKTVAAAPPPAVEIVPPSPPAVETAAPLPAPRLTGAPSPPVEKESPPLAGIPAGSQSASPTRLLLLGAILCACAAAYVIARRRREGGAGRAKTRAAAHIEVLASRQLGGKTRAVLLSVNDSQMLLAVSDHGARLLGQWYPDEDGVRIADRDIVLDSPLLPVADHVPGSPDTEPQVPVGVRRPSAAVAGLIKLKREGDARFAGDVARALRTGTRAR